MSHDPATATDYTAPEMVEMREAYEALRAAEKRVEDACAAARAAGYVKVGINRWEGPRQAAPPSDHARSENAATPFCKGGSGTCETCVGSCGVEEYEQRTEGYLRRMQALRDGY